MARERVTTLSMVLFTRPSVCWIRRQSGIMCRNNACLSIVTHRLVMRLDHRLMNVCQNLSSRVACVELGHDPDRVGPAGRLGWDFCRLLLVLSDPEDRLTQPALHLWIARQVLAYRFAHAREFAFDNALLRLAARREQDRAIARHETLLRVSDGMRSKP